MMRLFLRRLFHGPQPSISEDKIVWLADEIAERHNWMVKEAHRMTNEVINRGNRERVSVLQKRFYAAQLRPILRKVLEDGK